MSEHEIDLLELSVRSLNALKAHDVFTVDALRELTWEDFKKWSGVGRKSWNEIREVLHSLDYQAKRRTLEETQSAFLDWCIVNRQGLELVRAKKACIVVDFRGLEFRPDFDE